MACHPAAGRPSLFPALHGQLSAISFREMDRRYPCHPRGFLYERDHRSLRFQLSHLVGAALPGGLVVGEFFPGPLGHAVPAARMVRHALVAGCCDLGRTPALPSGFSAVQGRGKGVCSSSPTARARTFGSLDQLGAQGGKPTGEGGHLGTDGSQRPRRQATDRRRHGHILAQRPGWRGGLE